MIKKIFTFLILMFFIPFMVSAEELELEWLKGWGGSDYDYLEGAVLTDDEGFIILSKSSSTDIDGLQNKGSDDAIILKYDKDGNLLWQKSWGGNGSDIFYDLILLDDGSFIVEGSTSSTDIDGLLNKGGRDGVVVKFDKNGDILWKKNWGGNGDDYFNDILLMNDGSFFIIADSRSTDIDGLTNQGSADGILLKYDKEGNLLWQKLFGGNMTDGFDSFLYVNENEFIVLGETYSTTFEGLSWKGSADCIILKFDTDGNVIWKNRWGGGEPETIYDSALTADDGFILSGGTYSSDIEGLSLNQSPLDSTAIILRFDKDGKLLWQKSDINYTDFLYNIVTTDGAIIVCEYGGDTLIKYDKEGNVVWKKDLGGENLSDNFTGLLATEDGGFIAYGALFSTTIPGLINKGKTDDVIVKYDKDGNIVWKTSFGGNSTDRTTLMLPKNKNSFIKFGYTMSNDIDGIQYKDKFDLSIASYYVKYNFNNIQSENGTFTSVQEDSIGIITPKPNEGYVVDKVNVKDSKDEVVEVTELENGTYSFEIYDDVTVEVSFVRAFRIDIKDYVNGKVNIFKSDDNMVVITEIPDKGYEVDKIIVKNTKNEIIEVTKLEDGTYSFSLDDDVSVEVLFKEEVVNPKTGVIDVISTLLIGFIISFIGYTFTKKNCYQYDL